MFFFFFFFFNIKYVSRNKLGTKYFFLDLTMWETECSIHLIILILITILSTHLEGLSSRNIAEFLKQAWLHFLRNSALAYVFSLLFCAFYSIFTECQFPRIFNHDFGVIDRRGGGDEKNKTADLYPFCFLLFVKKLWRSKLGNQYACKLRPSQNQTIWLAGCRICSFG